MRGLKIGLAAAVAAMLALVIAVVIALQSLPDYESLKSSPNGQMIRVHAADGSVIVSLGPSFGRWMTYDQIPAVMVDAMVSTEDKRFYMHPGIDPVGMVVDHEKPGPGGAQPCEAYVRGPVVRLVVVLHQRLEVDLRGEEVAHP